MPDRRDRADEERTLKPAEIVTVGSALIEDMGEYLYVVVDGFNEPEYDIARLGGDGYQWTHIARGQLNPVMPQRITCVHDANGAPAYIAG